MFKRFVLAMFLAAISAAFFPFATPRAETGAEAWLRYALLDEKTAHQYDNLPGVVVTFDAPRFALLQSAQSELLHGIYETLGRTLRFEKRPSQEPAILLVTLSALRKFAPDVHPPAALVTDGFWVTHASVNGQNHLIITAENERGVLYGVFALTRRIALGESIANLNEIQIPPLLSAG